MKEMLSNKDWNKEYNKRDIVEQSQEEEREFQRRQKEESDLKATEAIFGKRIRRSVGKHLT